jgi:hypothetical protein
VNSDNLIPFGRLWVQANSFAEVIALAGVCDYDITRRAAARAFADVPPQWEKFLRVLKRRAELRYERGELLRAERRAHARWCGETVPSLI